MNLKKILIVIIFIIFVLGVGFALYWVFFRNPNFDINIQENFNAGEIPNINSGNLNIINNNINESTSLPWQKYIKEEVSDVAIGGLTKVNEVTNTEASGLAVGAQGLQYYDKEKQQFFRINSNGDIEVLSDKKFYGVENVNWSSNASKAILEYPDGSNILYNFQTGKQVTLPAELENFSFNGSGNQIVAKWIGDTEDNNWLIVSNDDGSGMRILEPLGGESHTVDMQFSPDGQIAALHYKYVDAQRQEVFPIGLHGENFKSFVVNGAGFTSQWSPAGNSLLYSVYSESTNYTPNLWITKGSTSELGDIRVSLNVSTWPDKCTFSGEDTLYCAVPQGLPRGAGFYPETADQYADNFYSIDLNSGIKTLLASPVGAGGSYTAANLFVSPDGSLLYFTNKNTGQLESIRLK